MIFAKETYLSSDSQTSGVIVLNFGLRFIFNAQRWSSILPDWKRDRRSKKLSSSFWVSCGVVLLLLSIWDSACSFSFASGVS